MGTSCSKMECKDEQINSLNKKRNQGISSIRNMREFNDVRDTTAVKNRKGLSIDNFPGFYKFNLILKLQKY